MQTQAAPRPCRAEKKVRLLGGGRLIAFLASDWRGSLFRERVLEMTINYCSPELILLGSFLIPGITQ